MAWFETLNTALSAGYWIFIGLFIVGIIGFIGWYSWYRRQYKYGVKLRILENNRFVYWEDVARRVSEPGGISYWYLKRLKEKAIVPPGESMLLSPGGQWIAEGFYDRSGGITWGRDTMSVEEFKRFIKEGGKSGEQSINRNFQPMTSTQRTLVAHQIEKAIIRKGQGIWQILWQLAPMVILLMIFVLILIFWKDIAAPITAMQGSNAEISKTNMQIQQQNLRMYQMLTGGKGNGTYIVQVIPSDEQTFGLHQTTTGG